MYNATLKAFLPIVGRWSNTSSFYIGISKNYPPLYVHYIGHVAS